MRCSTLFLLLFAMAMSVAAVATADPPTSPFGQTNPFPLDTNRIGFADSVPLIFTAAADDGGLAHPITLGDPQPNPFNPLVTIPFAVGRHGLVELGIYDLRGRLVRQLVRGSMAVGNYQERWDGRDSAGSTVAAGVYLVRVKLADVVENKKVSLVK